MSNTKTNETKKNYLRKILTSMENNIDSIIGKFSDRVKPLKVNLDGRDYISLPIYLTVIWYCREKAHTYSPSSWRLYRSALRYYAELEFKRGVIKKETLTKINTLLDNTKTLRRKDVKPKTSAMKSKKISDNELKEILRHLSKNKYKWGVPLQKWLIAGSLTGLRPSEWRDVNVEGEDDGDFILVVRNMKNTNGRSHGEFRTLDLSSFSDRQLSIIQKHINTSNKFNQLGLWENFYSGCASLMKLVTRKLWPQKKKYPTLYTMRHRFSSNAKASGFTTIEIAALMGHASDETAQIHYGRKTYGSKSRMPKPNKTDMKNVIKKSNQFSFKSPKTRDESQVK